MEEGLQEDGKTFLTFKKDEDEPVITETDNGGKKVDLSFLPEDSRGKVEELFGLVEDKFAAKLDALSKKAEMVDVLLEQVKNQRPAPMSDKPTADEKGLFEDVKFEDNDYYSKFFKRTFQAIEEVNKKIENLGGSIAVEKVQSAEQKMRSFFQENKLPKEVVQKMDEIATNLGSGAKAYANLPRLAKLAKFELGISDEKPKPNVPSPSAEKRRSSIVEFTSTRKTGVEKPVIRNMIDAWKAAEEQLSNND